MTAGARLTEALGAALARNETTDRSAALLVAAVDNFAALNASFGADIGEELVGAAARVIEKSLPAGGLIERYELNRIAIILDDCGPEAMRAAAEGLAAAVRNARLETSACPLAATISIGGVDIPGGARTVAQALRHAVDALHLARPGAFVAHEALGAARSARERNIEIARAVMSALEANRLRFAFQPIVSAETGEPALYECLLRLAGADGKLIPADEIVALAEPVGLSRPLDARTLAEAVALLKQRPALRLALNVSSRTAGDGDWLQLLTRLTEGSRQLTHRLTIEITETAAIDDIERARAFVATLREMGCRTALDDFGAGYASLKTLKHLDVDMLKIDGALVEGLARHPSGQAFVRSAIDIAKSLDMETVAEWVADEATAALLKSAGVTYLQGFLYGEPLELDALEAALDPGRA